MRKTLGLALVMVLLGGNAALARPWQGTLTGRSHSSVPAFNIDTTCRSFSNDIQESGKNCVAEENTALAQLKQTWTSFGAGARDECISLVTRSTLPSYVTLQDCLRMSQEAQTLFKQDGTKGP